MPRLLKMAVTNVKNYGVTTGGAGVKVPAQIIRSTGALPMVNGGVENLLKWFSLKVICRRFMLIGTRRMLFVGGPDVVCQLRLNGKWRRVLSRLPMATKSAGTNDRFPGAMKCPHGTGPTSTGKRWIASMSDCCLQVT